MDTVHELLKELSLAEIPEIIVFNKCDNVEPFEATALSRKQKAIPVSAAQKTGLPELIQEIARQLWRHEILDTQDAWTDPPHPEVP